MWGSFLWLLIACVVELEGFSGRFHLEPVFLIVVTFAWSLDHLWMQQKEWVKNRIQNACHQHLDTSAVCLLGLSTLTLAGVCLHWARSIFCVQTCGDFVRHNQFLLLFLNCLARHCMPIVFCHLPLSFDAQCSIWACQHGTACRWSHLDFLTCDFVLARVLASTRCCTAGPFFSVLMLVLITSRAFVDKSRQTVLISFQILACDNGWCWFDFLLIGFRRSSWMIFLPAPVVLISTTHKLSSSVAVTFEVLQAVSGFCSCHLDCWLFLTCSPLHCCRGLFWFLGIQCWGNRSFVCHCREFSFLVTVFFDAWSAANGIEQLLCQCLFETCVFVWENL